MNLEVDLAIDPHWPWKMPVDWSCHYTRQIAVGLEIPGSQMVRKHDHDCPLS